MTFSSPEAVSTHSTLTFTWSVRGVLSLPTYIKPNAVSLNALVVALRVAEIIPLSSSLLTAPRSG